MNDKIYIAGPMRGLPHFNFPAFDAAAAYLSAAGWDPINPAELDRESGMVIEQDSDLTPEVMKAIMHRDCNAIIDEAQAIAMLPGWQQSKGACAEYRLALWKGITAYQYASGSLVPLGEYRLISQAI